MDEAHWNKADIILTDNPDLTLFMRFADCTPILLYDPLKHIVGIVHSGWLGTVRSAARVAVEAMSARFGTNPVDLLAAVGPSIGPDHYEVGKDVIAQVKAAFNEQASILLEQRGGRKYFNLWAANRLLLEKAGVEHIEVSRICTACNPVDWFSHRGEKGKTGRFGAMIALS
jgi:YfiH family protein